MNWPFLSIISSSKQHLVANPFKLLKTDTNSFTLVIKYLYYGKKVNACVKT